MIEKEPTEITWGDVERFAKLHQIDQDEYFMLDMAVSVSEKVWTPDTWNLAVWLAPGQNEGYYLHVDTITRKMGIKGGIRKSMAGGKFWSIESGQRAQDLITRYLHGWPLKEEKPKSALLLKIDDQLESARTTLLTFATAYQYERGYWKGVEMGLLSLYNLVRLLPDDKQGS